MGEFRSHRCWDGNIVARTVETDVAVLGPGEDAVFLAAHVSLPVEQRKPATGTAVDEQEILREFERGLRDNSNQNTVIAITGPSGSGKSHLVKWVRARLQRDDSGYELLYVPRRVTSLREITNRLLDQLGGNLAEELRKEVDRAFEEVDPEELRERILDQLRLNLKFRLQVTETAWEGLLPPDDPSTTKDRQQRRGLPDLLLNSKVRQELLKDGSTLDRLARSVYGEQIAGEADDEYAQPKFEAEELNFSRLAGVRGTLEGEEKRVFDLLSRESARTMAAGLFNEHCATAVQEVLGFRQGRGIHEVFAEARQRLHGRQLVLLFEDLAHLKFVEGAVLDEFANHGDEEQAPLRVMFAVTDDKYAALAETIEGRVTHRYWVRPVDLENTEEAQDLRQQFIARWFNVARVGAEELAKAHSEARDWTNKCHQCEFRQACHTAFGSVEFPDIGTVGLYPLNATALAQGVRKQATDRRQQNRELTARNLVETLVRNLLLEVDRDLEQGQMPGLGVRELLNQSDHPAFKVQDALVPNFVEKDPVHERYYRLRAHWFDYGYETPEVAEAFALPPLGSGLGEIEPDDGEGKPEIKPRQGPAPLEVSSVGQWAAGEEDAPDPETAEKAREILRKFTNERVNLERHLLHSSNNVVARLKGRALSQASFRVGTSRAAGSHLEFPLERGLATTRILTAAFWYRDHQHWDFDDPARKWSIGYPSADAPQLAVELETFLDLCAQDVEGAVVAALYAGETDPATLAIAALDLALLAVAAGEEAPAAWSSVSACAGTVLGKSEIPELVPGTAAARQSAAAEPAAIDSRRTRPPDWRALPPIISDHDTELDFLVTPWNQLREAADAAVPTTYQEVVTMLDGLSQLLADDEIEDVVTAVETAVSTANSLGLLDGAAPRPRLEEAASQAKASGIELRNWTEFRTAGPDLGQLLKRMQEIGSLSSAHSALVLLQGALKMSERNINARLEPGEGGHSLGEVRSAAIRQVKRFEGLLES